MVERLLQKGFDETSMGKFEVRSAGTHALVGQAMTPRIAGLVRIFQANDADFVSRQLSKEVLEGQNLVLTLTRQHRSKVLETAPTLLRRTFTLREFGRMVRSISSNGREPDSGWSSAMYERWEQLLPLAASVRHEVMANSSEDDVVDPYRRDDHVHQRMVEQISPAVHSLIRFERSLTTHMTDHL